MKYAIISDIHANLEALNSVIKDAQDNGVARFICLGDIVGYNANPSECIDIIRNLGCQVVMGNHDSYTTSPEIPTEVNGRARESLEWTRAQISEKQHQWLAALPMHRKVGTFEIIHASLHEQDAWNYVTDAYEAILHLQLQQCQVCFYGHTHRPMYFTTKARKTFKDFDTIELEDNHKYYINVGSVGQPRGEDNRAQYVIYDTTKKTITLHRAEYDIQLTCKKIREAGLPEHNALRLEKPEAEASAALKTDQSALDIIQKLK